MTLRENIRITWLHAARLLAASLNFSTPECRFAEDISDEVVDVDGQAERLVTTRAVQVVAACRADAQVGTAGPAVRTRGPRVPTIAKKELS